VVTVQRAFRAKYAKEPPTEKTIRAWYKQLTETGCLSKQKSSGHPLIAEDDGERVQARFLHTPKKSTGTAANELSMSTRTVWRVLRKRLVFVITDNIMKRPVYCKIRCLFSIVGSYSQTFILLLPIKYLHGLCCTFSGSIMVNYLKSPSAFTNLFRVLTSV